MATTKHEVTAADGTAIPVWVSGEGRPLLMVHGATSNHEAWEPVRPYLEPHMTVATMDRRSSFGDPSEPFDFAADIGDVVAVAESLGEEVDVLGHSSGGLCAMGAALQLSNLRRLVLYEPPPVAGMEPTPEQAAAAERLGQLLEAGDAEGIHDVFLKDVIIGLGAVDLDTWDACLAEFRDFAPFIPREMAAIMQAAPLQPEAFADIEAPTLFLTGESTPPDAPFRAYIEPLRQIMPRFAVQEIPGQEHLANFAAPNVVAESVLAFLEADEPLAATR